MAMDILTCMFFYYLSIYFLIHYHFLMDAADNSSLDLDTVANENS